MARLYHKMRPNRYGGCYSCWRYFCLLALDSLAVEGLTGLSGQQLCG